MKQRYFKRQITDQESVDFFVSHGIPLVLAQAMSARGISQADFAYFSGKDCFHSPLEMQNMQEAVEIVSYILEEGGSVLICGDYDADGLTASAILSLFLSDNGIENDVIIPTREMGYGLHAETVIEAFHKKFYDLIITVDCGISNKEEVETILEELGTEIIVTDHHELPEELPPCLCVNPKMGYAFPNLSGAGVAWKLVEALAGREVAAKYSDLAMIGTVGDLMPMTDENRSLVKMGLANWNHRSLKKLSEMSKCPQQLSVNDVAMKIAPKINAAGRMGNPEVALKVLLSRDRVCADLDLLNQLNEQRKVAISALTEQADKMCNAEQIRRDRLVFLHNEGWQHGILGIAAARYKEKFGFPAVVLAFDAEKGVYVGSARSVDGIDLFETFSACKHLLAKFGGHKAAVGFSVTPQNLLPLKDALVTLFAQESADCFQKKFYYDVDLCDGCDVADMFEFVQKMQPTLPQDKVLFHVSDCVKYAAAFGKDNAHLSVVLSSGLELKSFGKRAEYAPFIRSGANVEGIVSLDYDEYNKRIYGIVEDMRVCNSVCFDNFYKLNFLKNFLPRSVQTQNASKVADVLQKNSVLAVFDDYETYLQQSKIFNFSDFYEDIFFDNSLSEKTVAISPNADYCFEKYQNVVYFCKQNMVRSLPQNTLYFCVTPANENLYSVQLSRELCIAVYAQLKRKNAFESVRGVYDKYLLDKMDYSQYLLALRVFEELQFIQIVDKYTVKILPAPKTDLTNSAIFSCFA